MATPAFFDYEIYMTNKLVQMQKAEPAAGWTMSKLMEVFAENGFVGAEGAYAHFTQFGAAEEVAPNASFNANEYYAAKAAQFYKVEPNAVTEFQIANIKQIITSNGMNAWTHYQQFGSAEGVNPSNAFDADAYLAAKAVAMGDGWTAAKIADAIKANGMTVLDHYLTYAGKGEGEVAKDATFPVPNDKKVPSDVKGNTYELTVDRDTFTGTSQDDQFIADIKNVNGTETATLNVSDVLDGGAGFDTLTAYNNENVGNLAKASISNIEKVVAVGSSSAIDLSSNADVQEVWVKNGTSAITVTKAQLAGYEGTLGAQNITFTNASGTADAATVALNGVTGTSVTVAVSAGNEIEAQTLNLAGKNTLTSFSNAKMTSLTITGDGSLAGAAGVATAVAAGVGLQSVDASAATGDLTLSFTQANLNTTEFAYTGSKGADKITFEGALAQKATINLGAGDDSLTLKKVGATGSTYNGGEGTDTLVLDSIADLSAAQGKLFTGFENLKLAGDTASYEVGQIAGITSYEVAATTAATITKLADGATVTASANAMAAVTLNLADPSAATSALNITLDNGAKAVANGVDLTTLITNAHVLNIASKGMVNTTDANGVTLSGDSLANITNVHISGDQALDFTTGIATALTLIDGSSATGKLTITATGADKAMTIKGGSADDEITGSAHGDKLFGGAGDDKLITATDGFLSELTGGEGKDTFDVSLTKVAAATDKAALMTKQVVITDFAKGDTVDLTTDTDVVTTIAFANATNDVAAQLLTIANKAVATSGTPELHIINDAANHVAYVLLNDGDANTLTNDVLVQLTGITTPLSADNVQVNASGELTFI